VLLAFGILYIFLDGAYLSVWFLSLIFGLIGLLILSIPRYVLIGDSGIEIHCVLDMTTIPANDILSVRLMAEREYKHYLMLLGSYGFFGFFGYYLDIKSWEIVKFYAASLSGMIEIEDIYEQRYIVSSHEPEELIKAIEELIETELPKRDKISKNDLN